MTQPVTMAKMQSLLGDVGKRDETGAFTTVKGLMKWVLKLVDTWNFSPKLMPNEAVLGQS